MQIRQLSHLIITDHYETGAHIRIHIGAVCSNVIWLQTYLQETRERAHTSPVYGLAVRTLVTIQWPGLL